MYEDLYDDSTGMYVMYEDLLVVTRLTNLHTSPVHPVGM